jgi:hypothetical protein
MTIEFGAKKKFQFEQAPMEKSLQDYYANANASSFFNLAKGEGATDFLT